MRFGKTRGKCSKSETAEELWIAVLNTRDREAIPCACEPNALKQCAATAAFPSEFA